MLDPLSSALEWIDHMATDFTGGPVDQRWALLIAVPVSLLAGLLSYLEIWSFTDWLAQNDKKSGRRRDDWGPRESLEEKKARLIGLHDYYAAQDAFTDEEILSLQEELATDPVEDLAPADIEVQG